MTKSFDEWFGEAKKLNNDGFSAKDFFEAGQQSKQAEVDELKREMLNKTNEAYADGQKSMRKMIKSNEDELQKRIDEAIAILSSKKKMYVDMVIEVEKALKGGNK